MPKDQVNQHLGELECVFHQARCRPVIALAVHNVGLKVGARIAIGEVCLPSGMANAVLDIILAITAILTVAPAATWHVGAGGGGGRGERAELMVREDGRKLLCYVVVGLGRYL